MAENKHARALPKILPGSVQASMIRCGRAGCRCERGELHGPYYYHYWREFGQLRKRYIKPADVPTVQSMCRAGQEERRRQVRTRRLLRETSMETWRSAVDLLRQVDQIAARKAIRSFYGDDAGND